MLYWFTGQPGHGKTVLALERVLKMKAEADKKHADDPARHPFRELYVCNVRDFNHGKVGAVNLTPEALKTWADCPDHENCNEHINPAFHNSIVLVDEAYEHGMFPRRPPGGKLTRHCERVAKHRHHGIDFVMVCQSPKKQVDDFLHDLIEEHYHVRRRYGLPFVHLKRWDRFEPNPDKAESLTTTRRRFPVEIFKLYTSTKYDTSEKRVPWFYWALGCLIVAIIAGLAWNVSNLRERFGVTDKAPTTEAAAQADGARATAVPRVGTPTTTRGSADDYVASLQPRVPGQPWTAPIYDKLSVPGTPPRLFCMAAGEGKGVDGEHLYASCGCLTEQGTVHRFTPPPPLTEYEVCVQIARTGQYEPFLDVSKSNDRQRDDSASAERPGRTAREQAVIGYEPGTRADVFPRAPGAKPETFTGPTMGL